MSKYSTVAQKREKIDPFSLSFLDIISCGFGAVVVLILLFRFDPFPEKSTAHSIKTDNSVAFNKILAEADVTKKTKETQAALDAVLSAQAASEDMVQRLRQELDKLHQKLSVTKADNKQKQKQLNETKIQIEQVKTAGARVEAPADPDAEAGGILVDRDYVIFIIDTSGSMRKIWRRVADQMTQILKQHPRVKGIQVMNDNGSYLISAYAKRWITDTPRMRERILKILSVWSSTSNSSPVEGLVRALTDFQSSAKDMSIYVLGDDYSGNDFDMVIETVRKLNKSGARINAINFINPSASTDRFSILMREITYQNSGTLIAM